MEILLEMLSTFVSPKYQRDGALALCTLAKKANALSPIDVAPLPPTPQVSVVVNSSTSPHMCTEIVERISVCGRDD